MQKSAVKSAVKDKDNACEMHISQAFYVVEVRGVEPLSESSLIRLSPSEAKDLGFPSPNAPWRAVGYGSFIFTGNVSKL